jgi:hypothetical protein
VSHFPRRLVATLVALLAFAVMGAAVGAAAFPDSTWVELSLLPQQGQSPIFALAVDPVHNQVLIGGNSQGALVRSTNAGVAWTVVHPGSVPIVTIAFNPYSPAQVLAGTRGAGALVSNDGGATWSAATGLAGRDVRVFAFSLTVIAAGTDHGVYASNDGSTWHQSGLATTSINAIAILAIHSPVRLVAGGDSRASAAGPPLYQSLDDGTTWTATTPPISGTSVIELAAGPLPPTGNIRPLVVGTNAGLFMSTDNAVTFTPLSGGDLLPSTDYSQIFFANGHYDRIYVASDGGGSGAGGLWYTGDSGRHFRTLIPPLRAITALAVSNDNAPILFAATFRTADHKPGLWGYHDTGGPPKGPAPTFSPPASGSRGGTSSTGFLADLTRMLQSSQAPYLALGALAVLVLLLAMVSNLRNRRH